MYVKTSLSVNKPTATTHKMLYFTIDLKNDYMCLHRSPLQMLSIKST